MSPRLALQTQSFQHWSSKRLRVTLWSHDSPHVLEAKRRISYNNTALIEGYPMSYMLGTNNSPETRQHSSDFGNPQLSLVFYCPHSMHPIWTNILYILNPFVVVSLQSRENSSGTPTNIPTTVPSDSWIMLRLPKPSLDMGHDVSYLEAVAIKLWKHVFLACQRNMVIDIWLKLMDTRSVSWIQLCTNLPGQFLFDIVVGKSTHNQRILMNIVHMFI